MTRALRVMIDARMLVGAHHGIARFVTRLASELAGQEGIAVFALCAADAASPWNDQPGITIVPSSFSRGDRSPARRWWWEARRLPGVIRDVGVDLFHATWNSGVPLRRVAPSVLTLHDLIPLHRPLEYFSRRTERFVYERSLRTGVRRAAMITTVSRYVRDDLVARLPCEPERVVAVHNGVDSPAAAPPTRPADPTYALYVGGHERRKNIPALLAAMRHYWERFNPKLELRLTGQASTLTPDAKEAFRALGAGAGVRFLGRLGDEELNGQYSGAGLLLLLSEDEGFGLPALEAMNLGCPVVAADRASLPEVVGDAGALVDPDQPALVAAAMHRILSDDATRERCAAMGRARARTMTWRDTATCMRTVYERAASAESPASKQAQRRPWSGSISANVKPEGSVS